MAQELDQDRVRAAGVAAPVSSKQDYLDRAADPRKNFLRTADADDPHIGKTSVRGFGADPTQLPGQVFAPSQLPDPAAAVAAGFPPVQIPEHLILDNDDDLHPQGPEPSERAIIKERAALRKSYVERAEREAQQAAESEDEDAAPQQGTSKTPAGGSPGTAQQAGGQDGGSTPDGSSEPDAPATEAPAPAPASDEPDTSDESEGSSSSGSRRGRGSRSRS